MDKTTSLPEEAFKAKTEAQGNCIVWTGAKDKDGYGTFSINGIPKRAHRWSWEQANGPIPHGMVIDHTCHNPACCNAAHLQAVTIKQNQENRKGAQKNSKSGVRGVYWDKYQNKWRAQVRHNRATHLVGRFNSIAEAEVAVIEARQRIFTNSDQDRAA